MMLVGICILAVQMALGVVFLMSALSKLRDPRSFIDGVISYRILPAPLAVVFGLLLMPLEIFVSISLLAGWMVVWGIGVSLILLLSFGIATSWNLLQGRKLRCHCFGTQSSEYISLRSLARIGILFVGSVTVFWGTNSISLVGVRIPSLDGYILMWPLVIFVLIVGMWLLALPELTKL